MRRTPRPNCCASLKFHQSGCPVQALLGRDSFAQSPLEKLSNLVIFARAGNNLVPFKNAPRVSVHNEDRVIARIQKNRVRGLRPYTIEREQFVAELSRWPREHPVE